jgi:subtilisin-like proprotein convertase family protein
LSIVLATPALAAGGRAKGVAASLRIEILPGSSVKLIDPTLAERVPVVVFGTETQDVHEIDPATLVLAGAAITKNDDGSLALYRDVDGDGNADMIVQFAARQMKLGLRSTRAALSARTTGGRVVYAYGEVTTIESVRAARRLAAHVDPAREKLPPLVVGIDVLPGDATNRIELGNRGTVPVAVLSAPGFDATRLEPTTITLAGAPVTRRTGGGVATTEDVNGDGRLDLVVEVPKALLRLASGTTSAVLAGLTPEGRFVRGTDVVSVADTSTLSFDSDDPKALPEPPSVAFAASGAITINDVAAATPYPASIAVSGLTGVISKVRVTLRSLSHTFPKDIDILLVGPTGQNIVLMSDVGGPGPGVASVNLTFDDDAAITLDPTTNPPSGIYRPVNFVAGDSFPAPAPLPTPATTLSAFQGTDPNGTWSLYVVDDAAGDTGTIAGGWQIDFVMASEFCSPVPITIFDNAPAGPYPALVTVAGLTGVVNKVTATMKGLTHGYPQDIDAMLTSPNGQTCMIMSDTAGLNPGVSGVNLVFDDNAALTLNQLVDPASGTYRPEDHVPGDSLPAPAPPAPYQANLSVFQSVDPNGVWSLYVADDTVLDTGSIAQFCLEFTTMTPLDGTNPASLTIPAGAPGVTMGAASLYPSPIAVTGAMGVIQDVSVTLRNLSHTFPQDLDVLLVAPSGNNVMLMSDVGGGGPGVVGATYTFVDGAPAMSIGFDPPGTYRPSNDDSGGSDTLPGPAPFAPYGSTFAGLRGFPPNGTWNLFVSDDASGDVGSLASGWTLTVKTYLQGFGGCNPFSLTIPAGAPGTTQGPANGYPTGISLFGVPADLGEYRSRCRSSASRTLIRKISTSSSSVPRARRSW